MEEEERIFLKKEINESNDNILVSLIIKIYDKYNVEIDPFLKKWEKACLIDAVRCYRCQWYNACRLSLYQALAKIDEITKDPTYRNLIDKHAKEVSDIDLKKMIEQLQK